MAYLKIDPIPLGQMIQIFEELACQNTEGVMTVNMKLKRKEIDSSSHLPRPRCPVKEQELMALGTVQWDLWLFDG